MLNRFEDGSAGDPIAAHAKDLSQRERQVVDLTLAGLTLKEMGEMLGCSVKTVHSYRNRAMEKCGVNTILDLMKYSADLAAQKRLESGSH